MCKHMKLKDASYGALLIYKTNVMETKALLLKMSRVSEVALKPWNVCSFKATFEVLLYIQIRWKGLFQIHKIIMEGTMKFLNTKQKFIFLELQGQNK